MQLCTNYVSTYTIITYVHYIKSDIKYQPPSTIQFVYKSCLSNSHCQLLEFLFLSKNIFVSLISCYAHNLRVCLCLCVVCGAYTCISNTTPLSDLAVIHTLGQGCIAPEGRGWVSLVPDNLLWARKNSMIIIVCSHMCKTFRTSSVIYPGSHTHTWFPTSLTNPQPHMLCLHSE